MVAFVAIIIVMARKSSVFIHVGNDSLSPTKIASTADSKPMEGIHVIDTTERYSLPQKHMAVIASATYNMEARRGVMIPLLAKHLRAGEEEDGDIYEAFLHTNYDIAERLQYEGVPVFMSTLTKKLCLGSMFIPTYT